VYRGARSKQYVVMGSTAPIYQALLDSRDSDCGSDTTADDSDSDSDSDSADSTESGSASDRDTGSRCVFRKQLDRASMTFFECTKNSHIGPPAAFDFHCLTPADYLELRESHRVEDATRLATKNDFEEAMQCVMLEQAHSKLQR
jgi:hypothetical protein